MTTKMQPTINPIFSFFYFCGLLWAIMLIHPALHNVMQYGWYYPDINAKLTISPNAKGQNNMVKSNVNKYILFLCWSP